MTSRRSFILLLICSQLRVSMSQNYMINLPSETCASNEFFNSASLDCLSCGDDGSITATADGMGCECSPGYKKVRAVGQSPFQIRSDASPVFQCEACPDQQVVTPDGWDCTPCPDGSTFNTEDKTCTDACGPDAVLQTRDEAGALLDPPVCLTCAELHAPEGDQCVPCRADIRFATGFDDSSTPSCSCPSETTSLVDEQLCVPSSLSQTSQLSVYSAIPYPGVTVQQTSPWLENNLASTYYSCEIYRNIQSCQQLANMCVVTLYHQRSNDVTACALYETAFERDTSVFSRDISTVPALRRLTPTEVLGRTDLNYDFTVDPAKDSGWLRVVAFKFSANGTFLGKVDAWKTGELQVCKSDVRSMRQAWEFGREYRLSCAVRVRELVDQWDTVFLDPYLEYEPVNGGGGGQTQLYSVAIRVTNTLAEDTSGNMYSYVRRLHLVDNLSGSRTAGVIGTYLSRLELSVSARLDSDGKIFPPLLTATYASLTADMYANDGVVTSVLNTRYTHNYKQVNRSLGIAVGVIGGLGMVYVVLKINSWRKRAGGVTIDLFMILKFAIFWFGITANIFFLIILIVSLYWLIAWRNQDVLFILLPYNNKLNQAFLAYFATAFSCKAIEIIHLVTSQTMCDIFFIDWERPKSTSNNKGESGVQGVSIWRTYFVANEWNEIQTIRKTNIFVQLFSVLFFLEVLNFKQFARADPNSERDPQHYEVEAPFHEIIRFAVGASIYVLIGIVQYLFEILVYTRFIEDPFTQFVDLCSISNVSTFIMSQKLFGYYIHGRSVHGFADANLAQLALLMQKEENDLRGQRGLLPDTSTQVFEMTLPRTLRTAYNKLYSPPTQGGKDNAGGAAAADAQLEPGMRKSIEGYKQLNNFLAAFINRDIGDCDYEVRDRPLLERVLDMEFADVSETKGTFYNDDGHGFDQILFYGNEMSLFIFDVLLFTMTDYIFTDYILAATVVFIVQMVLVKFRSALGQWNLARKTLVDERFLI